MQILTRQVGAVAAALALSASPALARTTTSSAGTVKAKTPLTAEITKQTSLIEFRYTLNDGVDEDFGRNAVASSYARNLVDRIRADSAQQPAKLEWVLGADVQRRADNTIAYGQHELVYHHPVSGRRLVAAGLAELRLSNYFLADADSQLGVAHPRYLAAPYPRYGSQPVKATAPLIVTAPKRTLAGLVAMGMPLLQQTIPQRILGTYVGLNHDAANYLGLAISRLHVDPTRRSTQEKSVDGVRTLARGDEQLSAAIDSVDGRSVGVTAVRRIQSALETFRDANSQISTADSLLGLRHSRPTVTLPAKIVYMS